MTKYWILHYSTTGGNLAGEYIVILEDQPTAEQAEEWRKDGYELNSTTEADCTSDTGSSLPCQVELERN